LFWKSTRNRKALHSNPTDRFVKRALNNSEASSSKHPLLSCYAVNGSSVEDSQLQLKVRICLNWRKENRPYSLHEFHERNSQTYFSGGIRKQHEFIFFLPVAGSYKRWLTCAWFSFDSKYNLSQTNYELCTTIRNVMMFQLTLACFRYNTKRNRSYIQ